MEAGESVAIITGLAVVGKPAAEVVKDFLIRVFGPTGDAVGNALAHSLEEFNRRRVANANKTLYDAARAAQSSGKPVRLVPGRILFPILEKASVEEEEVLRKLWSQLLAHSATHENVLPAFVSILGELSPAEAYLLQRLHENDRQLSQRVSTDDSQPWDARAQARNDEEIQLERAKEDRFTRNLQDAVPVQLALLWANLERLSLVRLERSPYQGNIQLTRFGVSFVEACTTTKSN